MLIKIERAPVQYDLYMETLFLIYTDDESIKKGSLNYARDNMFFFLVVISESQMSCRVCIY